MISWEDCNLLPTINRHKTSTISNISNIYRLINYENNGSTSSWSFWTHSLAIHQVQLFLIVILNHHDKYAFTFFKPINDCLGRILREMFILYHIVMQVVSQEFCTCWPAMSVKNSKEAHLWPFNIHMLFIFRFHNIQNDTHSIFIILSDDSLVSISSICLDNSTFLVRSFGYFMILQLESFWIEYSWVFSKKQSLNIHELNITVLVRFLCREWWFHILSLNNGIWLQRWITTQSWACLDWHASRFTRFTMTIFAFCSVNLNSGLPRWESSVRKLIHSSNSLARFHLLLLIINHIIWHHLPASSKHNIFLYLIELLRLRFFMSDLTSLWDYAFNAG